MSGIEVTGPNGVLLERWDDATRLYTDFRTDPDNVRSYTARENADADARAAEEAATSNEATIEQALSDALATLQAIIDDTNANINTNPAQRIKDEARALRRVIRLLIRRFDGTA